MQGQPREAVRVFAGIVDVVVQLVVWVYDAREFLREELFLRLVELRVGHLERGDRRQRLHAAVHQLLEATDADDALALRHDAAGVVVLAAPTKLRHRRGLGDGKPGLEHADLRLKGLSLFLESVLVILELLLPAFELFSELSSLLLHGFPSGLHLPEGAADLVLEVGQLFLNLFELLRQPIPFSGEFVPLFLQIFGPVRHS
mmetsp:Transcript_93863/g.269031  ORF Transcript_93863/g.269031 Transcript_93863/m.269031 type:complete len:201 (+) Transcript_93863:203-805(+)